MSKTKIQIKPFKNRFKTIFKHPFFWILTIIGNTLMLAGGLLIMIFEMKVQPNLSYLDFLLWSAGIVTTIGYGGYTAETTLGKLIVLMLMLVGTLFIWSYMAFLVTALFAPELSSLEKDFHDVEKEVRDLRVAADNEKLEGAKKEKITHSLFE